MTPLARFLAAGQTRSAHQSRKTIDGVNSMPLADETGSWPESAGLKRKGGVKGA